MLKTAQIVSEKSADDEVGMNNTVEVYFEDEDETEVFKLVTSVRGSSLNGKISIESPMGKAVLGHKVNDRVYVKVNELSLIHIYITFRYQLNNKSRLLTRSRFFYNKDTGIT